MIAELEKAFIGNTRGEHSHEMGPSRILVSNDDGISAPGIVALVAALGSTGSCDVYVSAPRHESSASSHAITLGQHLTAAPVKMQGSLYNFAVIVISFSIARHKISR